MHYLPAVDAGPLAEVTKCAREIDCKKNQELKKETMRSKKEIQELAKEPFCKTQKRSQEDDTRVSSAPAVRSTASGVKNTRFRYGPLKKVLYLCLPYIAAAYGGVKGVEVRSTLGCTYNHCPSGFPVNLSPPHGTAVVPWTFGTGTACARCNMSLGNDSNDSLEVVPFFHLQEGVPAVLDSFRTPKKSVGLPTLFCFRKTLAHVGIPMELAKHMLLVCAWLGQHVLMLFWRPKKMCLSHRRHSVKLPEQAVQGPVEIAIGTCIYCSVMMVQVIISLLEATYPETYQKKRPFNVLPFFTGRISCTPLHLNPIDCRPRRRPRIFRCRLVGGSRRRLARTECRNRARMRAVQRILFLAQGRMPFPPKKTRDSPLESPEKQGQLAAQYTGLRTELRQVVMSLGRATWLVSRNVAVAIISTLLRIGHNPYVGVRVGEASHPGPRQGAGIRRTRRVRKQKEVTGLSPAAFQQIVQAAAAAAVQAISQSQGFQHTTPRPPYDSYEEPQQYSWQAQEQEYAWWKQDFVQDEPGPPWRKPSETTIPDDTWDYVGSSNWWEWNSAAYQDPETGWWDREAWQAWFKGSEANGSQYDPVAWPTPKEASKERPDEEPILKRRKVSEAPKTPLQAQKSRFAARIVPQEWDSEVLLTNPQSNPKGVGAG